jgi:hypothetical protein
MIYNYIIKGDIKNSLETICDILYTKHSIPQLENNLILVCNYIGLSLTINDAYKWYNIVDKTCEFIYNDKIEIDKTLVLISKMCILCKSIIEKKPISINQLRSRLIHFFDKPLTSLNYTKFKHILPSIENDSFHIASKIANGIDTFLSEIINISISDKNFNIIIMNLRLSIELICRKNIWIDSHINEDHDVIWLLWALFSVFTNDSDAIKKCFQLFMYNWKKSMKKNRIGMLWGSSLILIIYFKSELKISWSYDDNIIFEQIQKMSTSMMDKIKLKYPPPPEIKPIDINFISTYIPKIQPSTFIKNIPFNTPEIDNTKFVFI